MHKSRKMFITKMHIKLSYMINVQVVLRLVQLFCDAITDVNTRGNCVITHNEYRIKENLNLLNTDERKQSYRTSFRCVKLYPLLVKLARRES